MTSKPPPQPIIPAWLREAGLRSQTFRIYCQIVSRAGKDGGCWQSVDSMAKECLLDPRTVQAALQELVERGLVTVKRRPGFTNIYYPVKSPFITAELPTNDMPPSFDAPATHDIPTANDTLA